MVNGNDLHIRTKKNMKTMRSIDGKRIFRTTDEKASQLYIEGEAHYAPKSLWKESVRDIDSKIHNNKVGVGFAHKDTKSNKTSKAQKRHLRKNNK